MTERDGGSWLQVISGQLRDYQYSRSINESASGVCVCLEYKFCISMWHSFVVFSHSFLTFLDILRVHVQYLLIVGISSLSLCLIFVNRYPVISLCLLSIPLLPFI